jgi:hypothetical protein
MSNSKAQDKGRIYRTNWKMFILRFSTFFLQLAIVAITFGMFTGAKLLAELDVAIFKLFPYFGAGLFIFAVIFTVYQFTLSMIRFLGTYIKVTESGIEYHNFPYYGLYCQWHEIDRLEKITKHVFKIDVLFPSSFQHIGNGTFLGIKLRKDLGIKEETFIPLSGFSGWSDGKLAKDIKKYAGHILEDK